MELKSIEQKSAENTSAFLEHGPGLRYSTNTWILAKSADGKFVKLGGLGGMGCGVMWFRANKILRADPEWAEAPVMECTDSAALIARYSEIEE